MHSPHFQFHLITDRKQQRQPFHEIAQLAEEARVDYFQLREKDVQPAELLKIARHIRPFLIRTKLIINGSLDVALAAQADGIHLQKENLPVSEVRKKYPSLIIGYSAHSAEEIRQAELDGATYVFASPVFAPISKVSYLSPIGCEELTNWIADCKTSVIALGGITSSNLKDVAKTGAGGVAGISLFLKNGYFDSKGMVM
jgi:thiamine-phosphate diphosphorylase